MATFDFMELDLVALCPILSPLKLLINVVMALKLYISF